jgi:phosphoribosyl 1,2-cyclic phosphodiesterase/DNA-binding NarL/FixJ family response regulator
MKRAKKRILIADPCKDILQSIKRHKSANLYQIETALSGQECLKKLQSFQPDLVIIDFMLPEIHGIEILRMIKDAPLMGKIGVVVTSFHGMIQNYHSAIKQGANYFLEKPFPLKRFFEIIHLFFEGKLHPDPFPDKAVFSDEKITVQPSHKQKLPSYIKFWGTRGSNPVSGPEYVRFGGNTCCLEIRHGKDLVIIDAGSGIRGLGQALHDFPEKEFNILLSHTHWDHLLGFPFFYPIYQSDRAINIWAPVGFEKTTKELFADMLAYAYFPVGLEDIQSKILFKDLRDSQTISFGEIRVSTHYAYHPGATLCFRIQIGNTSFGYITDNEFLMGCHKQISQISKHPDLLKPYEKQIAFFKGCDFIIHEAQYTPKEYSKRVGWGHSSISNASYFLKSTNVKDWIVVHHDPRHTDEDLLRKLQLHNTIMTDLKHHCHIQFAYDGMMVPL